MAKKEINPEDEYSSLMRARDIDMDGIWRPNNGERIFDLRDIKFTHSMIDGEENMDNLHHLPYMNWVEWIKKLNNFKYAVHLMRTHAAGTFALNCAYLGIPCIGYRGLDTQQELHPFTSVEIGDIDSAKKIIKRLKEDKWWYNECSIHAQRLYEKHFSERVYIKHMENILNETD